MTLALVTGGSGFVGRHLLGQLRADGREVETLGRSGVDGVVHHAADLGDRARVAEILAERRPGRLFHLSGVVRAVSVADYYRVNSLHAATLLDAIEIAGLKAHTTLVLVGTAAECGRIPPDAPPVAEDFPCVPLTHYGISKLAQTRLGLAAAREGFRVVVARPANLVGPGMPPHANLSAFAAQLAAGPAADPVELITGNLDAVRDYVDVRDACALLVRLADNPAAAGELVNLASGRGTTTRAALDGLVAASGRAARITVDPARGNAVDVPWHVGDPSKLARLAGGPRFRPLSETLRDIWNESRARLNPA